MSKKDFFEAAALYHGKTLAHGDENQYEKVEWVCKRKHRFSISLFNVRSGIWCQKCSKEEEKEDVAKAVHELATWYGGKCLSKNPFSMTSRIKLKCSEGHIWNSHPNAILIGSWCKVCEKSLFNEERFEKIKKIVAEHGGKLNSGIPQSSTIKLDITCSNGHTFKPMVHSILVGSWCQLCGYKSVSDLKKFPLSLYQKIAEEKGGKVVTTLKQYDAVWPNLEFQCANKHTWITAVYNIRAGHWCPKRECHFGYANHVYDRIGFDAYVSSAKKHGGKLLSSEKDLLNSQSLLKWECENGHVFEQYAGAVRTSGKWCIKCNALNKKNRALEEYRKWATSQGGKLLTKSVTGYFAKTKFDWECANGHKFSSTAANMKLKVGCSICNKEELKNNLLLEVNKIAVSKGGKCVSTEYLNNYTHLEFRCKNGHTFFANANNVKSGWWCKFCSGSVKLDIEFFQNIAFKNGGKLLSKEYININHSLDWQCKNGHKFHMSGYIIKNRKKWCPHCNSGKNLAIVPLGQKYHYGIEDMHKLAKEKGGSCISKTYHGSSTKLEWKCAEGHKWLAVPAKIRFGSWCKICRYQQNAIVRRLPLSDIAEIVAGNKGKLLSSEKSYELNFPLVKLKCKEGHIWETDIKYIKYGSWCPDCMYDNIRLKTRFPYSHYQKLVNRKGAKLLTDENDYQNSRGKLKIKCKRGHVFEKIAGELNNGSWCVECG